MILPTFYFSRFLTTQFITCYVFACVSYGSLINGQNWAESSEFYTILCFEQKRWENE